MSPIRIEPSSDAHRSKSGQADIFVTVHHSTTSNFALNKPEHDIELAFEAPQPVTTLTLACDGQILILSAECKHHPGPFPKPRLTSESLDLSTLVAHLGGGH
jgi:hypothetical protein